MDYCFIRILSRMLVFFQIFGKFEIANRGLTRTVVANQPPNCLRTEGRQEKKNSFLWTIDKPVEIVERKTGKPAIRVDGDDALVRPKRRPEPSRSYFFGTIHVPYSQVWDYVSPSTKQAFEDADHVIFELDLTNRRTVQALTACQILPDGQNLQDVLPGELFRRLKNQLDYVENILSRWTTPEQKGLGFYSEYLFSALTSNWHRKRPVWVMLMLNSLTENEIKSRGIAVLDLYLAQEATRLQKQIGAVERVEEQCQPLNDMDIAQVIFALDQSLLHHEKLRTGANVSSEGTTSTEDLVYHYNCGDLNSVIFKKDSSQASSAGWSTGRTENNSVDEYFRVELIQKRNRRMAKRVIELLETYPKRKFFFAFGAGHFLGNHSVIDYMAEMGYNVTHLPANHQIKSSSRNHGRRRNRQRNTFLQADSTEDLSLLNRWGSNEQFLQDTDRLLANLRSDYVDDRAYERDQRRKEARINSAGAAGNRLTTPVANRNFNELWIRHRIDTTTSSTTHQVNRRPTEASIWLDSSSAATPLYGKKFGSLVNLSVILLPLGVFLRILNFIELR